MNEKITWQKIFYPTGELKYEGFAEYSANVKDLIPNGQGVKYFQNGNKYMEGSFGDWFIETGIEYYENGNIRFIGEYNKGPRTYLGPRYFVFGRLFKEDGSLWYKGSFHFSRSNLGYPSFLKEKSFVTGTEFNGDGTIKKKYFGNDSIEENRKLPSEILNLVDDAEEEIIVEILKRGYSLERAKAESKSFRRYAEKYV